MKTMEFLLTNRCAVFYTELPAAEYLHARVASRARLTLQLCACAPVEGNGVVHQEAG